MSGRRWSALDAINVIDKLWNTLLFDIRVICDNFFQSNKLIKTCCDRKIFVLLFDVQLFECLIELKIQVHQQNMDVLIRTVK